MRLLPKRESSGQATTSLADKKQFDKENDKLGTSLIEWQNVMYESGVPEMMLGMIGVEEDPFLAN